MFWGLFIFRGHSTLEPASIVCNDEQGGLYYSGETGVSHGQHRKNSREVLEKMQVIGPEGGTLARKKSLAVSVACIAMY